MIKYKRYNAIQLAKQYNTNYQIFDIFRQTTLEDIVKHNQDKSADEIIDNLLKICKFLLKRSIICE